MSLAKQYCKPSFIRKHFILVYFHKYYLFLAANMSVTHILQVTCKYKMPQIGPWHKNCEIQMLQTKINYQYLAQDLSVASKIFIVWSCLGLKTYYYSWLLHMQCKRTSFHIWCMHVWQDSFPFIVNCNHSGQGHMASLTLLVFYFDMMFSRQCFIKVFERVPR